MHTHLRATMPQETEKGQEMEKGGRSFFGWLVGIRVHLALPVQTEFWLLIKHGPVECNSSLQRM